MQHWGNVDLVTFVQVLHDGHAEDQMIATFALGHTRSLWAREILFPCLQHEDPGVRWAVALSLGAMRDERVQPMLVWSEPILPYNLQFQLATIDSFLHRSSPFVFLVYTI